MSRDLPIDLVGPLAADDPAGWIEISLEWAQRPDPQLLLPVACAPRGQPFPSTLAPDVLIKGEPLAA